MERKMKNIKNEKKKPPIFILFLLFFMVLVLYLIYFAKLNYTPIATIEYKGYAVTGNSLTENLLRSDLNGKKYLAPLEVKEDAVIYKKLASYFIGKEKKNNINLDYPIYINNNLALLNMADESTLITKEFEQIEGYKNSILTDGILYNLSDFERADYNEYIFLKTLDNMYINLTDIEIKTVANKYTFPKNSIINFKEDFISYYYLKENRFCYETIIDIELDSLIDIDEEITYREFLTNLNIIKEKNSNQEEENIEEEETEEEKKTTNKKNRVIKVIESQGIDNNASTVINEQTIINSEKKSENTSNNTNDRNTEDNNQNKEERNENDSKSEEQTKQDSQPGARWIKPKVSVSEFETGVYTTQTNLSINDPSGAIKTAVVFEVLKDNKVYLRSQATSSGKVKIERLEPNTSYEIRGIYRYSTENGTLIEVEFTKQKIKTGNIENINPIALGFQVEHVYSDKIELSDFKITSDLNQVKETIAGVSRGEIVIGRNTYNIASADLRRILNGQTINLSIEGNYIKSNSKYNFEIKMYDIVNNAVQLENNKGSARTSKTKPTVTVKVTSRSQEVKVKLNYTNPDKVAIENKKYEIIHKKDGNEKIVAEGEINSNEIVLNNLDFEKSYIIKIYGDYDLDDNTGKKTREELASVNFLTGNIDQLGDFRISLNIDEDKITEDSAVVDVKISEGTNNELISILTDIEWKLSDDSQEITKKFSNEDLEKLKNNEKIRLDLTELKSNTKYTLTMKATIESGNTKKIKEVIFGESGSTENTYQSFWTLKQEAKVNIKKLFILNNLIDFDIKIDDPDEAISDKKGAIEIFNEQGENIFKYNLNDISKTERITISNLEESNKYYLVLYADKYSTKNNRKNEKIKYFEFSGNRIENTTFRGNNAGALKTNNVKGNIELSKIERSKEDNGVGNLIDVESEVNWYSECFNTDRGYLKKYENGTLRLGVGNSTSQMYIYDLTSSYSKYAGQNLRIKFKYKKSDANLKVYIHNNKDFVKNNNLEIKEEDYSETENGYFAFDSQNLKDSEDEVIDITTDRYIGLLLEGKANSYIDIQEFEVMILNTNISENTETESEYQGYNYNFVSTLTLNLNLFDNNVNENITDGIYYIRLTNLENKDNTILYKYTDCKNEIINYQNQLGLTERKKYKVELLLKNPEDDEREYILYTTGVERAEETKEIKSVEEYLLIQPNGNYKVSADLNLDSGDYKFGNANNLFGGILDFGGNNISRKIEYRSDLGFDEARNYKYYLFYGFSDNAIIKNLYLNLNIDLKTEGGSTNVTPSAKNALLVYENQGRISDIMINLENCTESPLKEFSVIGYRNKGILENFVIYLKSNYYTGRDGSLGFVYCSGGTIRNGYIASIEEKNDKDKHNIIATNCEKVLGSESISIGGIATHVEENSVINNVYSLVNVEKGENNIEDAIYYVGNLIGTVKGSRVENVYSVGIGDMTEENSQEYTIGPSIAYPYSEENYNSINNSYFTLTDNNDDIISNNYNTKVGVETFKFREFQRKILNSDQFWMEGTKDEDILKYFPKIIYSDSSMPKQVNIEMIKNKTTKAEIQLVEPIEDGDTEKLVKFTITNPQGNRIENISIEGLEINIIDTGKYKQQYANGITILYADVTIPKEKTTITKDGRDYDSRKYSSQYFVESIKEQDADANVYESNRPIVELNYYYQIKDKDDWQRINIYTEDNYRIIENLDFSGGEEYYISEQFCGLITGKYNGQTAKIKNIGNGETMFPLFSQLKNAKISNISIEGFKQRIGNTNSENNKYFGGLIGSATSETVLDDIYISGGEIVVNPNINSTDTFYVGGLVANATNTIIRNCSVADYRICCDNKNQKVPIAAVGGLVGYSHRITINNCFTRKLDINLKIANSQGIGGIVGRIWGDIYSCYSIGKIESNASTIGGIFGKTEEEMIENKIIPSNIQNCYSLVNIKTDGDNIGGIGGSLDAESVKNTFNNIALGNLYTSATGSNINLYRVIGTVSNDNKNYAYSEQLINGFKKEEKLGAQLMSAEEIKKNSNNLFNRDYYVIEDLSEGNVPKLKYYENSANVLPNQEDNKLPISPSLEITSSYIDNDNYIVIELKEKNSEESKVNADSITVGIKNMSEPVKKKNTSYDSTTHTYKLTVQAKPIYYLDSYEITSVKYEDKDGTKYQMETSVRIEYIQYKEIQNYIEWANEFCPERGTDYNYNKSQGKPDYLEGQNYKITGDINLKKIKDELGIEIPSNLVIGRLTGKLNNSEKPKIYCSDYTFNFNTAYSGIFKTISREISNVSFENIDIASEEGYAGVISQCTASQIENVDFKNININAQSYYVGCIADCYCRKINDIYLENIKCDGTGFVGSFCGRARAGKINNVTAKDITINKTIISGKNSSNGAGGIFGFINKDTSVAQGMNNISIYNVEVNSNTKVNSPAKTYYAGGIVGYNGCKNITNFYAEKVKINTNNVSNVGGIAGAMLSNSRYMYVYGINLQAKGGATEFGGIVGYNCNATIQDAYIEGFNDGTEYNVINAPKSYYVGGIVGYRSHFEKTYAKNLKITGRYYVGGINGGGYCQKIENSVCQDCEVKGEQAVGGVIGRVFVSDIYYQNGLRIWYTYTNAKVTATNGSAGGLIGKYQNDKINNNYYLTKIYKCYVACSEITSGTGAAGAFIGNMEKPLYILNDTTKYYYSNLFVTNTDKIIGTINPVTNDSNLKETYLQANDEILIKLKNKWNCVFYKYTVENNQKVLSQADLTNLKTKEFYNSKDKGVAFGCDVDGKSNNPYDYKNINAEFPTLITKVNTSKEITKTFESNGNSNTDRFKQYGIPLPGVRTAVNNTVSPLGANRLTLSRPATESLPQYNIYASDVDKINIDFNKTNEKLYFTYIMNDGTLSEKIPINNRTFTFQYSFNSNINIILSNGVDEEIIEIKPENVNKKVSVCNEKYYYLDGSYLVENGEKSTANEFVNLYNGKALTKEGKIYDLITNTIANKTISGAELIKDSTPIQSFTHGGNLIETYYHYSKVIDEEEKISEYQIFAKNGNLSILDGKLKIYGDSVIVDSYNNKEYQAVLGLDGIIYDLKDNINYPENFQNENIAQMTNNLDKQGNIIMVLYKDGRAYAFNYITGKVIFDSNEEAQKFVDNLFNSIDSLKDSSTKLYSTNKEDYENAIKLQEKLKEIPIEEVEINLDNNSNSSDGSENGKADNADSISTDSKDGENTIGKNNSASTDKNGEPSTATTTSSGNNSDYVTVYDAEKNTYLVYKVNSLIKDKEDTEVVVSETEKLLENPSLREFYEIAMGKQNNENGSGIYLIIGTIIIIIGILTVMYRKKNY